MYLREKGYAFEERDVNKDIAASNEFARRGFKGVPAFVIGDDVVMGLDTAKIEGLLDYLVISCPECKARMRVPKGKGKIKITCSKCNHVFQTNT